MDNKTIETIEKKIFDIHGQLAKLPIPMDKYNPISSLLIEVKELVRLSSPPLQGIEELRDKFKKQFHFSFSATYDKVFNWFLPHISNDAEVKELRAKIERLKTEIESWAKDSNVLSDKLGGYSKFCIKTFGGHGSDFLETNVNELQAEIADLKSKLEQQGVSEWVSVEERLPEERVLSVLVFNGKAPIYSQCVSQYTWFKQEGKFKRETEIVITYSDITHWMPLPNPPKTN